MPQTILNYITPSYHRDKVKPTKPFKWGHNLHQRAYSMHFAVFTKLKSLITSNTLMDHRIQQQFESQFGLSAAEPWASGSRRTHWGTHNVRTNIKTEWHRSAAPLFRIMDLNVFDLWPLIRKQRLLETHHHLLHTLEAWNTREVKNKGLFTWDKTVSTNLSR